MRVMRALFKILTLPLIFVIGVVGMLVKVATNLSCYIVGPFLLFLCGCIVYAIVMQLWNQVAILVVLLIACFIMLFGASWMIFALENLKNIINNNVYVK